MIKEIPMPLKKPKSPAKKMKPPKKFKPNKAVKEIKDKQKRKK